MTIRMIDGDIRTAYFFLPLPFFVAGTELLEATDAALELVADVPLEPLTLSSFLFCGFQGQSYS